MHSYSFDEQSIYGDWTWNYQVYDVAAWDPLVDRIVLALTPDGMTPRDDYGMRRSVDPYIRAWSGDGTGYVTLVDPNVASMWIPSRIFYNMGIGGVTVGLGYERLDTGVTRHLARGRIPLIDTGGA